MGMMQIIRSLLTFCLVVFTAACGFDPAPAGGLSVVDAGFQPTPDTGAHTPAPDAGIPDLGFIYPDAGEMDSGALDAGHLLPPDAGQNAWTSDGRCVDPIVDHQPAEHFVGMTIQYTPATCPYARSLLQNTLTVGSTSLTNRDGQSREIRDWSVTTPWFIGDATGIYVNLRGLHDRLPLAECFEVFSRWCTGMDVSVQPRDDGFSIVWDWDARRQIR